MRKKVKAILATTALFGLQGNHVLADENIHVKDLVNFGINPVQIQLEFQNRVGIDLNLNDTVKVSAEDEGKNIRFENFDKFSIVVPIERASGPFNKDGGG